LKYELEDPDDKGTQHQVDIIKPYQSVKTVLKYGKRYMEIVHEMAILGLSSLVYTVGRKPSVKKKVT
jgi:hypothetical protein